MWRGLDFLGQKCHPISTRTIPNITSLKETNIFPSFLIGLKSLYGYITICFNLCQVFFICKIEKSCYNPVMPYKALKLIHKSKLTICPKPPFHFDSTIYKPGHFPTSDTEWTPGKRWQTMLWHGEALGLILENKGTLMRPEINLYVFSKRKLTKDFIKSVRNEIIYRFNLDLDLKEFINSFKHDPILEVRLKKLKGMRPMTHGSLYDYLVIAIMLQNAPVRRSVSMMQSLFENYGVLLKYDGKELYCMWEPKTLAKVPEKELRELKIGYRAKNLIRISEPFVKGEINEMELRKKSSKEQKKTLLDLYGIGPQSVGYIMGDIFHRWDFLEHISPWEGKILSKIIFNTKVENPVSEQKLVKFFEKYGKYKSLASHYIWEDIFWQRKHHKMPWLEKEIRL